MKRTASMMGALLAASTTIPAYVLAAPRADAQGVAEMLAEVKASVTGLRDDVMKTAEQAVKMAEKNGGLTDELKAKVDDLLPKFNEQSLAAAKLEGQLEAIEARTLDVEQLLAQGGRGAGAKVSAGREVAESDQLKAYLAGGLSGSFTMTPKATVTTADGSGAAWSEREESPVMMARRRLSIRQLLTVSGTGAGVIDYVRQTGRTNNAAPVAEEGAAPTSDLALTKQQAIVKKIATVVHASDEAIADVAQLESLINDELAYMLDLEEEEQILTGDGTGQNLSGLVTNATAFSAAAGLPNANRIERLRLAMLQVTLADYAADGVVLHPTDWAGIELTKDSNGRFVVGNADAPTGPRLWGLPVVESISIGANTWLMGAMRMAATLYDRQQTEILISSEHGTNFVEGMKTIKGTKREALAVKRPGSLVTGNFTFA